MSTEPTGQPSPLLIGAAAIATAYGLWQLLFPGPETPSATVFWMRLIFTGLGAFFLVVTFLRRNQ